MYPAHLGSVNLKFLKIKTSFDSDFWYSEIKTKIQKLKSVGTAGEYQILDNYNYRRTHGLKSICNVLPYISVQHLMRSPSAHTEMMLWEEYELWTSLALQLIELITVEYLVHGASSIIFQLCLQRYISNTSNWCTQIIVHGHKQLNRINEKNILQRHLLALFHQILQTLGTPSLSDVCIQFRELFKKLRLTFSFLSFLNNSLLEIF